MPNKADNGNLRGTQVEVPKGPGSFIGKRFRALVTASVNCVFNWKFLIPFYDVDGNYLGTKEATTVMGPKGAVTTFPAMGGASGGTTGNRWFKGVGAPAAGTLSADFTYVSISSSTAPAGPDHYYDLTDAADPDLWVCITAGTNATSVWFNLSGCP